MSVEIINRKPAFNLNNDGIIRSVSLIPYNPEYGYLLSTEERKGFPDLNSKILSTHPIGGKVEMNDDIPFRTGIREFCEELPYRLEGYNIEETVNILLDSFESCTKRYKDILVSKQKNLYNRFYVVNISEISDDEVRLSLFNAIERWSRPSGSVLASLFFWRPGDEMKVNPSSLMESFLTVLPNERNCRRTLSLGKF